MLLDLDSTGPTGASKPNRTSRCYWTWINWSYGCSKSNQGPQGVSTVLLVLTGPTRCSRSPTGATRCYWTWISTGPTRPSRSPTGPDRLTLVVLHWVILVLKANTGPTANLLVPDIECIDFVGITSPSTTECLLEERTSTTLLSDPTSWSGT